MTILTTNSVYIGVVLYVCMSFIALLTAMVLCSRSQDSLLSVSARRARVVFSTDGFIVGEQPCSETREITTGESHPESSEHLAGIEPKPLVH